ncbi:MAG TPA: hypothetical protein VGQ89_13400 [Candidatus Limnocylindrales bacterium]|jgi:hypothetical protein|nr:hypothetical protein [Candidatus Limnocylindrales bacterium]
MRRLLDELETTTERGVKTREELFSTIKGELTTTSRGAPRPR